MSLLRRLVVRASRRSRRVWCGGMDVPRLWRLLRCRFLVRRGFINSDAGSFDDAMKAAGSYTAAARCDGRQELARVVDDDEDPLLSPCRTSEATHSIDAGQFLALRSLTTLQLW